MRGWGSRCARLEEPLSGAVCGQPLRGVGGAAERGGWWWGVLGEGFVVRCVVLGCWWWLCVGVVVSWVDSCAILWLLTCFSLVGVFLPELRLLIRCACGAADFFCLQVVGGVGWALGVEAMVVWVRGVGARPVGAPTPFAARAATTFLGQKKGRFARGMVRVG